MFTFANPNTPIIASGTSVSHNGKNFIITAGVLQYFYNAGTRAVSTKREKRSPEVVLVLSSSRAGEITTPLGVTLAPR